MTHPSLSAHDTEFLIEPDALRALSGPITLIDARTEDAYRRAHLPGADFLTTYHCFVPDTSAAGMAAFSADVAARYAAIGVTHERPVVVYDDDTGMRAAREMWILEYLGHRDVRMLHGGLKAWVAMGGHVTQSYDAPVPSRFEPRAPRSGFVSLQELSGELARTNRSLIDVRDATEFAGRDETACCARRGHLPGAVWLEWTELLADGRFKSPQAIRALLSARGIDTAQELVPYCHRGARSANTYYALRYAGCTRVRNFIGSFHEWSAHEGAPVEV